jgi:hypothetical protein
MNQSLGASASPSGSRAPHQAPTGLDPTGFDPSRIDAELLAQLLWDFFGPHEPRYFLHDGPNHGIPCANERGVATYRQCAKDIVASLAFAAAQAIEARSAATVKQGAVGDESAVAESDAPAQPPPDDTPKGEV